MVSHLVFALASYTLFFAVGDGKPSNLGISYGDIVPDGKYPWMAYIQRQTPLPGGWVATNLCSGALIDSKHIITAFHCVDRLVDSNSANCARKLDISGLGVRLGVHKVDESHLQTTHEIEAAFPYGKHYSRCGDDMYEKDDIVILRLKDSIDNVALLQWNNHSRTCQQLADDHVGFTVAGYGAQDLQGTGAEYLLEADFTVENYFAKRKLIHFLRNSRQQVPMGGDSGGPYFINEDNQWKLYGIESGGTSAYSYGACVPEYIQWIGDVLSGRTN